MNRKRTFSKKGMEFMTIISLVIAVIVSLFLFIFVLVELYPIAEAQGTKGMCTVATSYANIKNELEERTYIDRYFASTQYELQCDVDFDYVSEKELEDIAKTASSTAAKYNYAAEEVDEYQEKQQYALNSVMAEHLVDCYQKMSGGTVFSEYVSLSEGQLDAKTAAQSGKLTSWWTSVINSGKNTYGFTTKAPPVFCAVCTKVYIDPEIDAYADDGSLATYLERHNTKSSGSDSLFEMLAEGSSMDIDDSIEKEYEESKYDYKTDHNMQAVVYYRRHEYKRSYADIVADYITGGMYKAITGRVITSEFFEQYESAYIWLKTQVGLAGITQFDTGTSGDRPKVLFKTFDELDELEDEYGFAVLPYEELALRCDLLANSYG